MPLNYLKASLKTAVLITTVLLLGAGLALAQQQVNVTAGPTNVALPDGSLVPMWGYTCGLAATGSTATCAALNPAATGTFTPVGSTTPTWSPVVITVPTGQDLQINLTNNLSFTPTTTGATANPVPTSLVIVGQVGGGLGSSGTSCGGTATAGSTCTTPPDHTLAQGATTWPIAGGPGATAPTQGSRVQSFSTEVAFGATTSLTWTAPRPGTYLLESGTHPSIQGSMGLYGIVVVTAAPGSTTPGATTTAGCAYGATTTGTTTTCAVPYNAEIPLLLSEIDPVQNKAVNAAVNTAGFSETAVWSGQPGGCGNPSSTTYNTCYPPAVNYTPLYYLINGVAFNKTSASTSLFKAAPPTGVTGNVLVRLVNAGLRMHVPSMVGDQYTRTGATTAANGFALIAEDGNPLPGVPRVQSEVFMAAGKTYDVMINVPAASATALPVYDRELSLSGNATARDAGMLAYISINAAALPTFPTALTTVQANPDTYNSVIAGQTLTVSDPVKGVIANDVNIYGVKVVGTVPGLTLNTDGTFTYLGGPTSFMYCGNGATSGAACATASLNAAPIEAATGITCNIPTPTYTSTVATSLSIKPPGVLSFCRDALGYPLRVAAAPAPTLTGGTVAVDPNGGFNATVSGAGTYTLTFSPQNSQGTVGSSASATLVFPTGNGPTITVLDGANKTTTITDYRWIIEEDRTFYIDPKCQVNPPPAACPTVTIPGQGTTGIVPTLGTNFHTSFMPVVATGCVGPTGAIACETGQTLLGAPAVCDVGNGVCRTNASQQAPLSPTQVHLDPSKRYYVSVLPGDAANPFNTGNAVGGHGMGGAPIPAPCAPKTACTALFAPVTVLVEPTPFQTAKVSVSVFEDDFPVNGEQDSGGGVDIIAPNEAGLGGFNVELFDDAGGTGDATGQMTYDMFNMPLSNSLAGTIDPVTQLDACPISTQVTSSVATGTGAQKGMTAQIVTCPTYESDGTTQSPLAGQALVTNLMPGRYGIVATPGADRIARGEEWLQTNTLDGQKAHDSFLRIGEPAFFQEFGPAGYHVSIGFANPATINARLAGVCAGTDVNVTGHNCNHTITGTVTTNRMSRTPDERLYSSGDNSSFAFTQCYVSVGDPDGEDFAFTKCAADGSFNIPGLPDGNWRVTVFDQWNDMLVDGLSTPVGLGQGHACSGNGTCDLGQIATNQWQANIYTRTYFDQNGNGIPDRDTQGNDLETGLTLVPTNIRFRDGSFSNFNNTDLNGYAGFNEVFPLFSWYVIETDSTRYKSTGTHVVYDAGGPADGTPCGGSATAPCGNSAIGKMLANTVEQVSVPTSLRVPGAVYCASADCIGKTIAAPASDPPSACSTSPTTGATTCSTTLSTGRIDPPSVASEGWQGFSGQNSFVEFGKKPYVGGENGGIRGHVVYASTRPFDDPQLLLQTSWEPLVPGVTINLYQESFATADGVTPLLKLVDTTKTTSWDDWAQGFYPGTTTPYMSCPGQLAAPTTSAAGDLFFFTLYNQPMWLDEYNNVLHGPATAPTLLPNNAQFKCYDGMHNWNQVQPAPYDGMYQFPSVTGINLTNGKPTGTNCTICAPNPDTTDPYRSGLPMLPAGKYVVEVVVPPGYELVKEEDKNILIGDNYIAPATQQFGGLSNIFILPDQAALGATYNANNPQNPTQDLGATPRHEGDTGSVETFWPCVGALRIVPDFISLFPKSSEVSPFAGASRHLCDRKEVILDDQTSALAKFYLFTSTHTTAHFTGIITDDFTSEFDPFSPSFGEKFAPANLPVSIKDFKGNEIARTYSDSWGSYDGITYSTWEVNPPNPTGYAPTMMVTCMNDAGPIRDTNPASPTFNQMITDPAYNAAYSQFCYEIPFMPSQTQYMDTPVVPTHGFAGAGYNNPDCAYPDATPAILSVTSQDIAGPWVMAAGRTLTINGLGDVTTGTTTTNNPVMVNNAAYSGPAATTAPFNQKNVGRHYGFGGTRGTVTIGGQNATISAWSETQITVAVPTGVPTCAVQQQPQYGGPASTAPARCGELVITAANGKQSIDTVTVTIGGKRPTVVAAGQKVQTAIDAANPGDMIIIPPGTNRELLIMWKPVRLQGVGAPSSIIDGNTHPAGKMDGWRRQINCLFGLALNGQPYSAANPYDNPNDTANSGGPFTCPGTGWNYRPGTANPYPNMIVDRIPREGILGWDATLNGNLAEQLQEPSLMGAYEGAAITVLGKGVKIPSGSIDVFGSGAEADFPIGSTPLGAADCRTSATNATNPYPTNFQCNPSSVDGLGITNSSQGGGGIFVHAWGHNLQLANNRVYNNSGTLAGGISVGLGEAGPALTQGGLLSGLSSCQTSTIANTQLPFCYDLNVNVHHNSITGNSSLGDELFSATRSAAGGATFCIGADYYKFNYNWVCGNLSTGDGGGVTHLGFIYNGAIEHNSILFNQSINPTIPTNGGGLMVMDAPDPDPVCGNAPDQDCPVGLGDGIGPGLVINANLIQGNAAESGSGGGLRFQGVNGSEVSTFPANPERWYSVRATNNIIVDNVAGWDGAGVSLQDALAVNLINNTIVSNDTTASSGILFNTLGAPLASSSGSNCTPPGSTTTSCPQPAGLATTMNSSVLTASFAGQTLTCPSGHYAGATAANGTCRNISYPLLANDIIWQNRAFYIGVGALGTGALNQQHVVALLPTLSQTATGQCPSGASYWDIGVRGDTGAGNHGSGFTLAPRYSMVGSGGYGGTNYTGSPTFVSQYCNGSRVPPENGGMGYQVPPGIADATVPNPIFNLTPAATVDEGNNWINLSWGPLSLTNPSVTGGAYGNYGGGLPLGNYAPAAQGSTGTIDRIPLNETLPAGVTVPNTDFFGNPRPDGAGSQMDIGAVEAQPPLSDLDVLVPHDWNPAATRGVQGPVRIFTLTNHGRVTSTGINQAALGGVNAADFAIVGMLSTCGPAGNGQLLGQTTLAPGASCVVTVQFRPQSGEPIGTKNATVSVSNSHGADTANLTGGAK